MQVVLLFVMCRFKDVTNDHIKSWLMAHEAVWEKIKEGKVTEIIAVSMRILYIFLYSKTRNIRKWW